MPSSLNSHRAEKRIARAKSKARPELLVNSAINEWTVLNLARRFDTQPEPVAQRDFLDRINVDLVTQEQFVEEYERLLKPVVLTNVTKSWAAKEQWTLTNFYKQYRNERFKCGEDDHGYNVKLKMKYFIHYMRNNYDDSPLYIFDGNFGEHRRGKQLLKDYDLPVYFKEDLFKYVGESRRPPHRWLVVGSGRSGTGIHIDPLGTSAWNALLTGYKRWCLFPTDTPRELIKLNPIEGGKQCHEAVQWFNVIYPRIKEPNWPERYKPIEILQRPDETVFVPSGWWHVVLNLTDTIAVTQNFVSTSNFPIVWHKTVRSRPRLSKRWLSQLKVHRPDLVELTRKIDINRPIGITSDSSSDSSSSSSISGSSTTSSCSCSSCNSEESDDSGQDSPSVKKRKRRDSGSSID